MGLSCVYGESRVLTERIVLLKQARLLEGRHLPVCYLVKQIDEKFNS